MANINNMLTQRLKKGDQQSSKMAEMAKQSANGNLTSFSGIFSVSDLSDREKDSLEGILKHYAYGNENISQDLRSLIAITSEVKAINNQAALLHGERVKKAHTILTQYRDGAFTAWLMAAYGNRQTPYNLMQYYEFCEALPKTLRPQIESMPRQAIYTLASREGPLEIKREIVEGYKGETKMQLLILIRDRFPLAKGDKRKQNLGETTIHSLRKVWDSLKNRRLSFTRTQKNEIAGLLEKLNELISERSTP